jgi:cytochrome c
MHRPGFAYSDAMAKHKAEAPTWGYDELNSFITAPARYVPGTKMSFAGIRDTQTRINLIAWLRHSGLGRLRHSGAGSGPSARRAGRRREGRAKPRCRGRAATEATGETPAVGAPHASRRPRRLRPPRPASGAAQHLIVPAMNRN